MQQKERTFAIAKIKNQHNRKEMVMEKENVTVTVNTQQHKSNAPWILGIIAFVASIPNILCATVCAAVAVGISETAKEEAAKSGDAAAQASASGASEAFAGMLAALVIISLICFILSFFGKSKISVISGILLILGALFIIINSFVGPGNMLWGSVTGICYLIAGCFSIINKKRIA